MDAESGKWIEWMWMWKVESGAVPDLTVVINNDHSLQQATFGEARQRRRRKYASGDGCESRNF